MELRVISSWGRGPGSPPPRSPGNRVFAHPQDGRDFEALVRYMMRPPVSLRRLRFTPGAKEVVYARKGGHDTPEAAGSEKIDAEEFVARVLVQIPDPRRHQVRYYGAYSNRARGWRRKAEAELEGHASDDVVPTPPQRAALRRQWANLIRRVYEVACPALTDQAHPGSHPKAPHNLSPPPPLQPAVLSIA